MPTSLESGLWDATARVCFSGFSTLYDELSASFREAAETIWFQYYRESVDKIPSSARKAREEIKRRFLEAPFYKQYEFVEFCLGAVTPPGEADIFCNVLNDLLRRELAAFRVADCQFIQVSNEIELEEVTAAIASVGGGVREHISAAARYYSAIPNPDYRNSIKESISAVESAVAHVCGGKPNGVSKKLRDAQDRLHIHPALWQGFEKLYSYTSDAGGIRHALIEGDRQPSQEDAKYMLVSCSAFSNFLISKATS
jgi:hypothetical protein